MNELFTLLQSRRSIRRFRPDPVPEIFITQMLEAATWAPSAHNRQPWRFAVMKKATTKERLGRAMGQRLQADLTADGVPADVIAKDVSRSYARITGAPLLILLCLTMADMDAYPDAHRQQQEQTMAKQSVAMAGQNLLLAAHALGLGSCWLCAPLFVPDTVAEVLALPPDWLPQALLTVGFPAETREKTRHPLSSRTLFVD